MSGPIGIVKSRLRRLYRTKVKDPAHYHFSLVPDSRSVSCMVSRSVGRSVGPWDHVVAGPLADTTLILLDRLAESQNKVNVVENVGHRSVGVLSLIHI